MAQRGSRPVRYHALYDKRHEVPLGTVRHHSPVPPDLRPLHFYRRFVRAIRTLSDTLACVQFGSADKRGVGATAVHVPVDPRGERRRRRKDGYRTATPSLALEFGSPMVLLLHCVHHAARRTTAQQKP
jgi:hypothetical protein